MKKKETYTIEEVLIIVSQVFAKTATNYNEKCPNFSFYNHKASNFLEDYFEPEPIKEEKDIPITWYQIRTKCEWIKFCDVTGTDYYAKKEGWDPKDNDIIYFTKTQAEKLHLI